jgi:hypothetical protein
MPFVRADYGRGINGTASFPLKSREDGCGAQKVGNDALDRGWNWEICHKYFLQSQKNIFLCRFMREVF